MSGGLPDLYGRADTSGKGRLRTAGLIVAAGRGQRLGEATPKQYLPLGARPVLWHALDALLAHPAIDLVAVVIHPGDRALYDAAVAGLDDLRLRPPVAGGAARAASVLAGLEAVAAEAPDRVLIHDAARPFLSPALISAILEALDSAPAALPALPVVDALWRGADGLATVPVPRDGLWRAQTPQGFHFAAILAAHRARTGDAADDAEVARAAGLAVRLVPGDEDAFKITTTADLERARARLGGRWTSTSAPATASTCTPSGRARASRSAASPFRSSAASSAIRTPTSACTP